MSDPSPALFLDTVNAYQRTEALLAAVELDLFTHVAAGRDTAPALATACAAPRGVRILADHLTLLGFLRKSGDRYALTPDSAAFLDRASPAYLGGAVEFLLAPGCGRRFGSSRTPFAGAGRRRRPRGRCRPTTRSGWRSPGPWGR
jgi:hypothetical protein